MPQPYQEYLDKILIPEDLLQARVRELAAEINQDYAGKELLVICILRGGVMFLTDLIRHIDVPLAIEFMAVSSYGAGARASQGDVRITLDLNTTIFGKHVNMCVICKHRNKFCSAAILYPCADAVTN